MNNSQEDQEHQVIKNGWSFCPYAQFCFFLPHSFDEQIFTYKSSSAPACFLSVMGKSSRKLHQVAPLSQETEVAITTQLSKFKKEVFVEVVLLFEQDSWQSMTPIGWLRRWSINQMFCEWSPGYRKSFHSTVLN